MDMRDRMLLDEFKEQRNVYLEMSKVVQKEIESKVIGEIIMEHLKDLDEVAYVRFASVYRQFKDVSTFVQEIEKLLGDEAKTKR